jgi:hypothetical protein
MFGETAPLSEAELEVLSFVQANKMSGKRTTLSGLVDHFEVKPYGWPLVAILCQEALLSAHGKLEMRLEGSLLANSALAAAVRYARGLAEDRPAL